MSYDSKDMLIFVTGVVGRAMGGGAFDASHVGVLTQDALAAFEEHLAPKLAQSAHAPRPAPSASGGPQKPDWRAGAAAIAEGGSGIGPETKSFSIWGGDKAYIFGRDGVIWADLLAEAQDGNQDTIEALKKAAAAGLGKDPKWHSANGKRIARAKACLQMIQGQG